MTAVFLKLLNMSITAGYLVLAVLLARLFLKKSPKWICCLLWGVVALRLILPFSFESSLSLIPSAEVIPQNITTSSAPAIHSGITVVNSAVNPMMTQSVIESGNMWQKVLSVTSIVWLVGMAALLLYGIISYIVLRWQIRASIKLQDGVYACDNISSPFIFGFLCPRIYLPSGLDFQTTSYVLLHERIHLHRKDHWWKPLGFCLLAVYWFNPLLWVAYILLCRDIEQSCDEKVIRQMDIQDKQGYSLALVSCSSHRRMIMACPVAFGQVSVKSRIQAIVNYKKPTFWILLTSIALCVVISVCFLTNPETCLHAYADEIIQPATCTQMGVESHTCTLCRYTYTEPVAMCSHNYDTGVILQEATCTADGSKEVTCMDCGKQRTVAIEKIPHHSGKQTILKAASCVDTGIASTICTVCQTEYHLMLSVDPNSHSFEETILRESTCTEAGEGIRCCTLCGHEEAVTYELAEHLFETYVFHDNTCKNHSYRDWTCSVCGCEKLESLSSYGSHAFLFGICRWCGAMQPGYVHNANPTPNLSDPFTRFMGDSGKSPDELGPGPIIWDLDVIMRPTP